MAVAGDNPLFITPPPGLIPERLIPERPKPELPRPELPTETDSATHRISSVATPAAAPAPVFFPSVLGAPPARPGAVPALVLPGGARHPLTSSVLIGRNPANSAEWPTAALLPVDDPAKTVSKTHAVVEVAGTDCWVHDLNSTNGVSVDRAGGESVAAQPGQRVAVAVGDRVTLGDFVIVLG